MFLTCNCYLLLIHFLYFGNSHGKMLLQIVGINKCLTLNF